MKLPITPVLLSTQLLVIQLLSAPLSAASPTYDHTQSTFSIVDANNHFGNELFRAVIQKSQAQDLNHNIFLSPLSAAMALQMLLNGADPQSATYRQISQALALGGTPLDAVDAANKTLIAALQSEAAQRPQSPDGVSLTPFTLQFANSIWGNVAHTFTFDPIFSGSLNQFFQAQAMTADFSRQSAADSINQWVTQATAGKIRKIVDLATLASEDLFMMNATYFKANWQDQFDPDNTEHSQKFTQGDGSLATVDMLWSESFGYSEIQSAQVVELPYSGGSVSMFIVLPKSGYKLDDVLDDSNGPLSDGFWAHQKPQGGYAIFSMPKVKLSDQENLIPILQGLGITSAFDGDAQFGRLGSHPAKINLIQQYTVLNIDEAGTEAAGLTGIGSATAGSPPETPPAVMTVNHPYILCIFDHSTGAVLFEGLISSQKK